MGSVASPSRRLASEVVDAAIVAAAGLGLRRLRGTEVAPFMGGWPLLAAMLVGVAYEAIITAGALRPPRRQGLHDRLAHVLVLDGKTVR